jgi:hypothetical protein
VGLSVVHMYFSVLFCTKSISDKFHVFSGLFYNCAKVSFSASDWSIPKLTQNLVAKSRLFPVVFSGDSTELWNPWALSSRLVSRRAIVVSSAVTSVGDVWSTIVKLAPPRRVSNSTYSVTHYDQDLRLTCSKMGLL